MSTTTNEFYCYSITLFHFLKANGIRYKYTTLHKRTGKRMWVFTKDDVLNGLLDEYDARKAQYKAQSNA